MPRIRAWSAVTLIFVILSDRPLSAAAPAPPESMTPTMNLDQRIESTYPDLERLYQQLHRYPELSLQEEQTSNRLAQQLSGTSFEITRKFGGHGIVAVLKNGPGPTVLIRTEMDALPIEEQTGLAYASRVRARDRYGNDVGVMHACGHDIHMTCWVGAAKQLASMRGQWRGTLVFIAQPAEECGAGASMMLQEGLFTKHPRPDYCLAIHCDPQHASGHVTFTHGMAMANVDMIDITVRGKGGHGAWPHMTIDPVVLSARLVLDLQTLVSRENNPTDPLVLSIGSIHGGNKHNIIPNEVKLQLTVRTTKDLTRKRVLEGIARLARAAADGAGAPEPLLNIHPNSYTPAVVNDEVLTDKTVAAFRRVLGPERVHERPPMMGGEDFALYGREGVPSFLYFLGTQQSKKVQESETDFEHPLPSLHSDHFAPVPEPTIKTGVLTLTTAVMNLLSSDTPTHASNASATTTSPVSNSNLIHRGNTR